MSIKDSTLKKKLCKIVDEGKTKTVTIKGKRHYISKKIIKETKDREKKEGGIFPLIPVFAGVAAVSSLAGAGAATGVNTVQYLNKVQYNTVQYNTAVNDKKFENVQLEQQEAHNDEVEKLPKGKCLCLPEYLKE